MKWKINSNTIIVRDFNTSLTPVDRSTKQKIRKQTQTINDTMDHLDLIGIYRTKEASIYNGEKTISLKSGAGKTSQPLVKE